LSMTSIFGIMVTLVGIVLYQKSSVNSCWKEVLVVASQETTRTWW
jgi:hypothetical protein